jgi:hypothetical protein
MVTLEESNSQAWQAEASPPPFPPAGGVWQTAWFIVGVTDNDPEIQVYRSCATFDVSAYAGQSLAAATFRATRMTGDAAVCLCAFTGDVGWDAMRPGDTSVMLADIGGGQDGANVLDLLLPLWGSDSIHIAGAEIQDVQGAYTADTFETWMTDLFLDIELADAAGPVSIPAARLAHLPHLLHMELAR